MTSSRRPECYLRLGFPALLVCKSRKSHTKKTWTHLNWFCLAYVLLSSCAFPRQNESKCHFPKRLSDVTSDFSRSTKVMEHDFGAQSGSCTAMAGVKRQNSRKSRNSVKQRRLQLQADWYSQLELLQSLGVFGIHKGINILKEKIQISHEKPCIFKVLTIIVSSFLNGENKSKFNCERRTAFLSASLLPGPPRVRSTHVRQGTPMSGAHSVRCLPGAPWVKIEGLKNI